jgi:hypothetical protein
MLTREDLEEIAARYHRADWDGFNREQAVLDIGRLLGHIAVLDEVTARLGRQWNDQRDARVAAERARDSLALRLPMIIAAGDALAEAIVARDAGEAELGLWRATRGAGDVEESDEAERLPER